MKKKQFKRFIAWGFTVLAVFLIASFSVPVRSFADSFDVYFTNTSNSILTIIILDYSTGDVIFNFSISAHGSASRSLESGIVYSIGAKSRLGDFIRLSSDNASLSYDSSNPSVIYHYLNISIGNVVSTGPVYVRFEVPSTPTPSPTPTPEPTPTPSPTQDPSITTDNEFWGKLNQNANGAWSFITQVFQGLFNNVVFRNLAIYLPLIGLIIGLVVYLFTMGGRND